MKNRTPRDCAADALALFEDLCARDTAGMTFAEKIAWRTSAAETLGAWADDRIEELRNEQLDSTVTAGDPNPTEDEPDDATE